MFRTYLTAAALSLSAAFAHAAPVDPIFDTFGNLPGATFGGTGIPTDPTAITTFGTAGGGTATIALSATPRFSNPAVGNDGAGTYFAQAGAAVGGPSSTLGALWNFNFFAEVTGSNETVGDLGLTLLYDFDPGTDTDEALLGRGAIDPLASKSLEQGSENLAFSFLASSVPPFLIAPAFGSFDPNAAGEYSFAILSRTYAERVAINVVVSPVPLPAGAWLMLGGLGGLALLRRRQRARG